MKFSVDTKAFGAALAIAGRVIPVKSPWPAVSNLRLSAEGTTLRLRGTNTDLTYEAEIAAQIEVPGDALVSHATLAKFFSAAKGETLSFEVEDHKATVKAGRAKIVLAAADASDFPMYEPAAGDLATLDGPTFVSALRFCSAAAENSEVKFNIAGVNISESGIGIEFWGTDGNAAHYAVMPVPAGVGSGTLPLEAVAVVAGICDKSTTIQFMICETGWHVAAGSTRAWGKVIDGKFPDMNRALNAFTGWIDAVHTGVAELSSAIDIATVGTDMNSDKTRNVIVRADGATATIRGHRVSIGTISAGLAELDCEVIAAFEGAINSDYLRAAVSGIGAGELTVQACDQAFRISPRQENSTLTMRATIMKVRIASDANA